MEDKQVNSNSESWNFAEGFVQMKILKHMIEMDKLFWIASHGYERIEDKAILNPQQIVEYRIEALERLADALLLVIGNTIFAVKEIDKKVLRKLREKVKEVVEVLNGVYSAKVDSTRNTKSIVINEEHFKVCLKRLEWIKEKLNEPLNNNGLIFRQSDELSVDEIKKRYEEGI